MTSALRCPHCPVTLVARRFGEKSAWMCGLCSGLAFNLAVLRDEVEPAMVAQFWLAARAAPVGTAKCTACRRPQRVIKHHSERLDVEVDVCVPCQLIWLDGGELEAIRAAAPRRHEPQPEPAPARASQPSSPFFEPNYISPRQRSFINIVDRVVDVIFTAFR